jgi:hypothetical protein
MQLLAFKLFKYCVEVKPHLIEQPVFTDFFVCDLINAAKIHATHRFLIQGRQSERIYSLVSVVFSCWMSWCSPRSSVLLLCRTTFFF